MIKYDLNMIAANLEALEETIIHKLIDRVQFKVNLKAYKPGSSGFEGEEIKSLLDIRLRFQEGMDAKFGRFLVPEERPFLKNLPSPMRKVSLPKSGLSCKILNAVNLTASIKAKYMGTLAVACQKGDDGQYGSSVEHDIMALQAISRRIHFGAFYVAESKFKEESKAYTSLINNSDWDGIMKKLTRKEKEKEILNRVHKKVAYAQKTVNKEIRACIDPDIVFEFFRDCVIPLTKEGEVLYLKNRTLT